MTAIFDSLVSFLKIRTLPHYHMIYYDCDFAVHSVHEALSLNFSPFISSLISLVVAN
jgi:hypothetical protein